MACWDLMNKYSCEFPLFIKSLSPLLMWPLDSSYPSWLLGAGETPIPVAFGTDPAGPYAALLLRGPALTTCPAKVSTAGVTQGVFS